MSNGSERINLGDVTGPRWVGGVNAPASGGGDYEALVKWLRDFEGPGSNGTNEAADAIEALAAERDALRAESVEWSAQYQRLAEGVSDGQQ